MTWLAERVTGWIKCEECGSWVCGGFGLWEKGAYLGHMCARCVPSEAMRR